jgi:hypothetical protein
MPTGYKLIKFNDLLKQIMDKYYPDIIITDRGFYYTTESLESTIYSITKRKSYVDTFKKQLINYGFYAQNHKEDQKYIYRTFPNQNGFPYKLLTNDEKNILARTHKTTPFKINNNVKDEDEISVIDETDNY